MQRLGSPAQGGYSPQLSGPFHINHELRKCPTGFPTVQSHWGSFSTEVHFLQGDSNLCRVGIKWASTGVKILSPEPLNTFYLLYFLALLYLSKISRARCYLIFYNPVLNISSAYSRWADLSLQSLTSLQGASHMSAWLYGPNSSPN